ncbi:hypothetical protein TPHA_0P01000 [Tetrapisispora phaffii CBS 4417]|uniref:Chromatin modification-related protein n=1 Tax=Tetrapisispora phaffii (strain ATCC 24235 / CBS 4417 / NBRC 1672 / NRRL Y-8282 / UCD 70-5) TaxID=1071381 RepID=G8C280_TETPH|nr:hypothetical protein TPHA_0P01000 [Tetrapisispora phaffii CBS 4417]CCE66258.1 hypothetical protein TPHA_0P01000 [Tetrapisispora phaffii CBS 4417]
MSTPANLFPGLSDISDVLEEYPIETSRYLTLLHEIDAKCIHALPFLNEQIQEFVKFTGKNSKIPPKESSHPENKLENLININRLFEELIPSLEEKMYVSSIMLKSMEELTTRLELGYEVALKNEEIPEKLRIGVNNHPAMHLHHELMKKIETAKTGTSHKSAQSSKSELRREAMAASKKQHETKDKSSKNEKTAATSTIPAAGVTDSATATSGRKNGNHNNTGHESKKRKTNKDKNNSTHPGVVAPKPKVNEYGEPLYCYCNRIAFGEMVGCDGANCELEWFHLPCIGLTTLPRGKWYCNDCKKTKKNN